MWGYNLGGCPPSNSGLHEGLVPDALLVKMKYCNHPGGDEAASGDNEP